MTQDSLIGKLFGKYRVVEPLGSGGMGMLFKAFQLNLERFVAIKLMLTHLTGAREFLDRFEQEAKSIAALNHPNIVQVYDYDIEDTTAYIVMELIEGQSLSSLLDQYAQGGGRIPLQQCLQVGIQMAQALAYAHQANIIHRDIKPGNIMLRRDGRAILTDFGLAKITTQTSRTREGVTVGTPAYMAPEQAMGQPGDPRSDLYSLGVVLYEMAAGQLPFQAPTPMAIVLKHLQEIPSSPRNLVPDIPTALDRAILRCLEKDPADRYPTAGELLLALQNIQLAPDSSYGSASPVSPWEEAGPTTQPPAPISVIRPPEPALPPQTADFIGREQEMAQYAGQFARRRPVIISGMPGTGKTAVAAALANQVSDPAHTFWHTFHAGESINALIWNLAGYLAWRGQEDLWNTLQSSQPNGTQPPPQVMLDYVCQLLSGKPRSGHTRPDTLPSEIHLLCLDDLHHIAGDPLFDHFAARLEALAAGGAARILIVTERRLPVLEGSQTIVPLEGLSPHDARQLLAQRGVNLSDQQFSSLYAATQGFAQLLVLVVDALCHGADAARLLNRLPDSEKLEDYLIQAVDAGLNEEDRAVMAAIAVLGRFPATRDAISAVLDGQSVRRTINELASRYLIAGQEGEQGREYSLHPLVRRFYYTLLGRRPQQEMHRLAAGFYLREERDPLRAAYHLKQGGDEAAALDQIEQGLVPILNRGQAGTLLEVLDGVALDGAETRAAARARLARGQALAFIGQQAAARAQYEQAGHLLKDQPGTSEVRQLQARLCLGMGELLQNDHPHEAADWLRFGLQVVESEQRLLGAAIHIRLGRVHAILGEMCPAVEHLEIGLNILPPEPSRLLISALGNLGNIYSIQGQSARGWQCYQRVLEMAAQIKDHWLEVDVRLNLGIELYYAGRMREAEAYYQQALKIAQGIGRLEQQLRAHSLLGGVYTRLGQYETAQEHLDICIAEARHHGMDDKLVYALPDLADVLLRQGRAAEAAAMLEEAARLAAETGAGTAEVLPQILRLQALVFLMNDQLPAALDHANQSVALARQVESDVDEGVGLRVRGQAQRALCAWADAADSFNHSLKILENRDPYEAARTRFYWGQMMMVTGERAGSLALLRQASDEFKRLEARRDQEMVESLIQISNG